MDDDGTMPQASVLKTIIWSVFALLALLWTAGSFIAVQIARWASQLITSGGLEPLGRADTPWPLPEGLPLWFDPALLQWLQQMALFSLEALRNTLPLIGSLLGWLAPLLWVLWACGLLLLLAIAGAAHWLVARQVPRPG